MNNTELKKLLMNVPIKMCRNMNNEFIKSILKDLDVNLAQQHYMVLKLLEGNKHLYVTEFVDALGITKPQMTSLVDKLIEMGYANRTNDVNDRRRIYISLTNEGEFVVSKINESVDKQIDKRLITLTQKELETLGNGLLVLQKLCPNCGDKEIM